MQDVTEAILQDRQKARDTGLSGRMTRQERQARVGILRNPASPPRPPARRAPLMGRWLDLRSSRRPCGSRVEEAAESVLTSLAADPAGPRPVVPVRRAADGSVESIDIIGLMASVEGVASRAPVRSAFDASLRADAETPPPPGDPRKPTILTAAAWIDDDSGEDKAALAAALRDAQASEQVPPHKPARRGRRVVRLLAIGIVLAVVALFVLPAWGALLPA
ncbi:MAG: hypothetical protein ACK4GT_11280 [Pararhodobacter sp.]